MEDVAYIRSGVEFTGISSVKDIKKTNSITVSWKLDLKYGAAATPKYPDLTHLYLLRAVLNPYEAADLSKDSIKDKFRVIYSWERDTNPLSAPVTSFTDKFQWDDNSESNLHNLNVNNDRTWNETKFKAAIRRIISGEQGIYYKIYGYSRRMNRAATPMGFFCDGRNIVALSQRNQVINDKWYSEGGMVWRSGQNTVPSGECFCRVVVDMNRDLGVKPRKCRRVWASTSKGRVVVFDYWTGTVIGSFKSGESPIYAIGFCAPYNAFLFYDGNGNVKMVKEDPSTHDFSTITKSISDFPLGDSGAKRVMGGICTTERDAGGNPVCYFYVISNRDVVVKLKIEKNSISKVGVLPNTHFGCTTIHGEEKSDGYVGQTPANQNNIYGIGAGINGQVWVNGHTPITTLMYDIKESGNPVRVYVRLGRGVDYYQERTSDGKVPSASQVGIYGGCHGYTPPPTLASAMRANALPKDTIVNGQPLYRDPDHVAIGDLVYELVKDTTYSKHYGEDIKCEENNALCTDTWDRSAKYTGEERPDRSHGKHNTVGCKGGIATDGNAGLNWVKHYINKYNYLGVKCDMRDLGAGKKLTNASFKYTRKSGPPQNEGEKQIESIHHELVAVFDGDIPYKKISFLQDLNYVYGCTEGENINDTNGQMEDKQQLSNTSTNAINYRQHIIDAGASYTNDTEKYGAQNRASMLYFTPMTKWLINTDKFNDDNNVKYTSMFGYAGEPVVLSGTTYVDTGSTMHTYDKKIKKPCYYDVRAFGKTTAFPDSYNSRAKTIFLSGGVYNTQCSDGEWRIDLEKYQKNYSTLPMSIGSITTRLPRDGRMYINKINADAYKVGAESNAIKYEIAFADRREGKIGLLNYNRASGSNADTSYKETNRRVTYSTSNGGAYAQSYGNMSKPDELNEYFPTLCANPSNLKNHLNSCPYHVVVDSDNNLWFSTPSSIGKLQLLSGSKATEKYIYNKDNGTGLHAFENNNTYFESSLVLLEKHANDGAKYGTIINPNGIENGYSGGIASAVYQTGQTMLDDGKFTLSQNTSNNKAFVYNYDPWSKDVDSDAPWEHKKLFGRNNLGVWNEVYTKTGNDFYIIKNNSPEDYYLGGNLNNEFNSDNFGLNSLIQMNRVEVGPDIIHPKILKPTADTRISNSVSTSHNERCDTFDGQSFWDAKTRIFDNEQSTSGYDDLDTTHQIYNIVVNGRRLTQHRYEYHDRNIVGSPIKIHPLTYGTDIDEDYELIHPDQIFDNSPEMVWLTPNYTTLVPPYPSLSALSASSAYSGNQYWVDLYLDFAPSVYNFWVVGKDGVYEYVQVGKHRSHVFERWPTPNFCLRGIGNSESIDKTTDYDLVGHYFWGDCTND